jgi:hypothetical protein
MLREADAYIASIAKKKPKIEEEPSGPVVIDEAELYQYLEEDIPSLDLAIIRFLFAVAKKEGKDEKIQLALKYFDKRAEKSIPSAEQYNNLIELLGSVDMREECFNRFVAMERDCNREPETYKSFLMFNPPSVLNEQQKKTFNQLFKDDQKEWANTLAKEVGGARKEYVEDLDFINKQLLTEEFHKETSSPADILQAVEKTKDFADLGQQAQESYRTIFKAGNKN